MTESNVAGVQPAICPSTSEIAAAVRGRSATAEQTVRAALTRVEANEPRVEAWEHLDARLALEAARRLDQNGASGPLAGVPVGVKDIIDTADQPTANGTVTDAGRRPRDDATAVARLRRAGAVILGKTVTTELACGASNKTRNPLDLSRTPGGSSSGSAAAIAAGMVPLALGSQTAGSVIRPGAFCGVWAMKPSYGLIPRTGMLTLSHTLDHVGFFGRSAQDLALGIDAISGDDGRDEAGAGQPPSRLSAALKEPIGRPRLAFLRSFAWPEMEPACAERFESLAERLGAEPIELGDVFDGAYPVHQTVMFREFSHYLWHYYVRDGGRLSDMLRDRLLRGHGIGADDYFTSLAQLHTMRTRFAGMLKGYGL
jgi:Asp-tRNA(Asn)/Glu-tRNA(Gln) amidotransferase A subunit family amidase